jgi:DNA-binding response OmpR family regulator
MAEETHVPARWKILIADSDPAARRRLADFLGRLDEFTIQEAESDAEVLVALKQHPFDSIIIDIALPSSDGRELCRLLRRQGVGSPILILLRRESDAEVILALDAGASDCVTKSVCPGVFLARLRAHLRQHAQRDDLDLRIQHHIFRPSAKLLIDVTTRKGVRLTGRETILLRYLYRMRGTTVSRVQLLKEVWEYNPDVTTHTIETHIWRLRKKLERDPSSPAVLITEADGYRLCVEARPEAGRQGIERSAIAGSTPWKPNGSGRARSPLLGS